MMATLAPVPPPRWTDDDFEHDRLEAIEVFRRERMQEPLEAFLEIFDERLGHVEDLLETTTDLTRLDESALAVLSDPNLSEVFRYLTGPPISLDDLKTVADVRSVVASRLRESPDAVRRLVETVRFGLDRRRFPWVPDEREPTEAERAAAALATAALIAVQRLATSRRNEGKNEQERRVMEALRVAGFTQVATRSVQTLGNAPGPGEFCAESLLGDRKADIIVGLWDRRTMPIECKVSNSSTNSIKRLNNDAAAKAVQWIKQFGTRQVVPTAALSGVYKLLNLAQAQDCGLTIFWAHNLDAMIHWIESSRGHFSSHAEETPLAAENECPSFPPRVS